VGRVHEEDEETKKRSGGESESFASIVEVLEEL
jgi:hypothetical protein